MLKSNRYQFNSLRTRNGKPDANDVQSQYLIARIPEVLFHCLNVFIQSLFGTISEKVNDSNLAGFIRD